MIRKDIQFGKLKEACVKVGLIYYSGVFRTLEGYTKKKVTIQKKEVVALLKLENLPRSSDYTFFVRLIITKVPMQ